MGDGVFVGKKEIRKGIEDLIDGDTIHDEGEYSPLAGCIRDENWELIGNPKDLTKRIMDYLHSQGVRYE